MIVRSIDTANQITLYLELNPLKGEISVIQKPSRVETTIVVLSAASTTFRIIDKTKTSQIKSVINYVKGLLRIQAPFDMEGMNIKDFSLGKNKVFALIYNPQILEKIKNDYPDCGIIEYEISSLLRLIEYNHISCERLLHFNKDYVVELIFENGLLLRANILHPSSVQIEANDFVSGFVPEGVKNNIINNPTNDSRNNVAFGGALHYLSQLNVNLLKKESNIDDIFLWTIIILLLSILLYNGSNIFKIYELKKKISFVDKKISEEAIKIGLTKVVDPLLQAKSYLSKVKDERAKDLILIIDKIGFAKSKIQPLSIYEFNITFSELYIEGEVTDPALITTFKNSLPSEYQYTIIETTKDPKGSTRFKLRGKR